jgi:hypothetical protein
MTDIQNTPAPDHQITEAEREYVIDYVIPALQDELADNGNTMHMFGPFGKLIHEMITNEYIKQEMTDTTVGIVDRIG